MIGLVGASGAGKSTLINLICRFYDVAEGSILADGVDIRSFPKAEYRANVGIVLQDPFLFYGTIAENIAYGQPNASHAQIIAAARAARRLMPLSFVCPTDTIRSSANEAKPSPAANAREFDRAGPVDRPANSDPR